MLEGGEPRPRFWAKLSAALAEKALALRGFDGRVTMVMLLAALLLLVFKKFGTSSFFESSIKDPDLRAHPYFSTISYLYWFLSCFILLGAIPYALGRMAGIPTGARLGDARSGMKWVAILYALVIPLVAAASRAGEFSGYYPLNDQIAERAVDYFSGKSAHPSFLVWFAVYEVAYALYFIGWEFFFRGFLTFGLYEKLGVNGILVGDIPFVLLHAGKPFPEALGSIVAGVALGLFALRVRSFWYCWLVHALVALSMDGLALQRRVELLAGS